MSDFHLTDTYGNSIEELNKIDKNIRALLKELKSNDASANTFSMENNIRKNLDTYLNKLNSLEHDYTKSKTAKYALRESEYNRRLNEINGMRDTYQLMNQDFEGALSYKYSYVSHS
jgi:hypothetical protein